MPYVEVHRTVPADPDTVFACIADMESYPKYMKSVERITVLERTPAGTVTEWVARVHGTQLRWVEEDRIDPAARRITYRQREGDLKKFEGYWQVAPAEQGCEVTLTVDFEFGVPMLAMLLNPVGKVLIRENCEAMLQAIAERVASGGEGSRSAS